MNLEEAPDGVELLKKLREPVPLCAYCVENPILWSRCEGQPVIVDFAATDG